MHVIELQIVMLVCYIERRRKAVIFLQYSRLHKGGVGVNTAEFASTCVHVVVVTPTNSKPESQL